MVERWDCKGVGGTGYRKGEELVSRGVGGVSMNRIEDKQQEETEAARQQYLRRENEQRDSTTIVG